MTQLSFQEMTFCTEFELVLPEHRKVLSCNIAEATKSKRPYQSPPLWQPPHSLVFVCIHLSLRRRAIYTNKQNILRHPESNTNRSQEHGSGLAVTEMI